MDTNECANSPCRPNEKCINAVGGYRCACPCSRGYQPNKFGIKIELFQIFLKFHLIPSVQEQGINIK
jgi:hypothetical protein